jgi:hypothetical protein
METVQRQERKGIMSDEKGRSMIQKCKCCARIEGLGVHLNIMSRLNGSMGSLDGERDEVKNREKINDNRVLV